MNRPSPPFPTLAAMLLALLLLLSPLPGAFAQEAEESGHMHGPDGRHIAVAADAGGGAAGVSILSHHDLKITDAKGAVVTGCEVNSVIHRKGDPGDVVHRERNAFEPENGVYGSHMVYREPGEYVLVEKIAFPDGKTETAEFPVWVPAQGGSDGDHGAAAAAASPLFYALLGVGALALTAVAFVLGQRSGRRRAAALLLAFCLAAAAAGTAPRAAAQEAEEEAGHMHGPDGRHIAVAADAGGGSGGAPVLRAYPGPNREASATKTLGAYRLELSIENEELKPDPDVVTLSEDARAAIGLTVAEATETEMGGGGGLAVTGRVRPNPNRAVTVNARAGGRVVRVGLTPGDQVEAGHVVAVIDSAEAAQAQGDLARARAEEREADAARERARAQVAEARAALEEARAEAERAAGRAESLRGTLARQQKLAEAGAFAQGPVEEARSAAAAAEGELEAARTALATLEAQAGRLEAGAKDGVVARREAEAARSAAAQGATRVATAEQQARIAREALAREEDIRRQGLRDAREVQQARADAEAAEASARAAAAAAAGQRRAVQGAEGAQAEAEARKTRARSAAAAAADRLRLLGVAPGAGSRVTVVAPIAGEVESRPVNAGEVVAAGQALASLLNTDTVWVESDVFEKDLPRVRVGQRVRIAADAAPGRTFTGSVSYVGGEVDAGTRAVRVRTVVPNRGEVLKPGMFVRALIAARGAAGGEDAGAAVTVPRAAVQEEAEGGGAPVVFVEEAPGAYRRRPVTLGPTLGDRVVVAAGLLPGEKVVTDGAYQLLSRVRKG